MTITNVKRSQKLFNLFFSIGAAEKVFGIPSQLLGGKPKPMMGFEPTTN
ncbi:hypothetical protein [Microcystis sp. BLCC-F210]